MHKLLFIAAIASATMAHAAPATVGQDYTAARAALVSDGWEPVASAECEPRFVCVDYPEAESCNTSGVMYCLFNWSRNGERLQILTQGETQFTVLEVRQ